MGLGASTQHLSARLRRAPPADAGQGPAIAPRARRPQAAGDAPQGAWPRLPAKPHARPPAPPRSLVLKLLGRLQRKEAAETVDEDDEKEAADEQAGQDARRDGDLTHLRLRIRESPARRRALLLAKLEDQVRWHGVVRGEQRDVAPARRLVHHVDDLGDHEVVLLGGAVNVDVDHIVLAVAEHARLTQEFRRARAANGLPGRRVRAVAHDVRHGERRGGLVEGGQEAGELRAALHQIRA
mmetsp:Transcript_5922/g.18573  ORF Transcript_5922/g.18573 Transcript_5922/m.18573 type:complete len:239 (-) Transcript_5922:272-988(-)